MTYSRFYLFFTGLAIVLYMIGVNEGLDMPVLEIDNLELLIAFGVCGICKRLDEIVKIQKG